MDDELQRLEDELRALKPAPVSREWMNRVDRELAAAGRRPRWKPQGLGTWWWGVPAAAALAVVTAVVMQRVPPTRSRPGLDAGAPALLKPVGAENLLYAARDEGLVTLADGTPARRARLNYVDTIVWKDARTNASLRWSVPREEIRVIPISFQ